MAKRKKQSRQEGDGASTSERAHHKQKHTTRSQSPLPPPKPFRRSLPFLMSSAVLLVVWLIFLVAMTLTV